MMRQVQRLRPKRPTPKRVLLVQSERTPLREAAASHLELAVPSMRARILWVPEPARTRLCQPPAGPAHSTHSRSPRLILAGMSRQHPELTVDETRTQAKGCARGHMGGRRPTLQGRSVAEKLQNQTSEKPSSNSKSWRTQIYYTQSQRSQCSEDPGPQLSCNIPYIQVFNTS